MTRRKSQKVGNSSGLVKIFKTASCTSARASACTGAARGARPRAGAQRARAEPGPHYLLSERLAPAARPGPWRLLHWPGGRTRAAGGAVGGGHHPDRSRTTSREHQPHSGLPRRTSLHCPPPRVPGTTRQGHSRSADRAGGRRGLFPGESQSPGWLAPAPRSVIS